MRCFSNFARSQPDRDSAGAATGAPTSRNPRTKTVGWFLAVCLLAMPGCGRNLGEQLRSAIPFLPQSKYVDVGGRKLKRDEVDYYQKIKDHSIATKINPKDPVAYNALGQLFQSRGNFDLARQLYTKAAKLDPTQSEAHHNLGVISLRESKYDDALHHLRRALQLSPDDAGIWHRVGQTYAGKGEPEKARRAYDKAIDLDDEYTPAYLDKAKLFYSQRGYRAAEAVCRQAIANLPPPPAPDKAEETTGHFIEKIVPVGGSDSEGMPEFTAAAEAHYDLALCLKAQGRLGDALQALAPAEQCKAGRLDIMILKSRLQEGLGNRPAAIATLEALRAEEPENAEVVKRLARLNQAMGRTKDAMELQLAAADLDYSDRHLQMKAARAAEASQDLARTIAVYERLVRIDRDDLSAWRRLAEAYDKAGIKHQAAFAYQEIVNRRPREKASRRRLGLLYADLPGFSGRALLQFKQILRADPSDVIVHRKMGELYLASGNLELAEKHIERALKLQSNHAETHLRLATVYSRQNRGADAVAEYREALKLDPKLTDAYLELAKGLLRIDRREEAIAPLEEYLRRKPDDFESRRLYANTLRDLNRREDAVREYNKIVIARPTDVATVMELARQSTLQGKRTEAAGMYEALLDRDPANVGALRAAAMLYDKLDQPLRSMYCWQRLLKLRPDDLDAKERLAAIYKAIGSDDEAIKMYEGMGHAQAWRNVAFLRLRRAEELKSEQGKREQSEEERKLAMAAYRKIIEVEKQDVQARLALGALLQQSDRRVDREQAIRLYKEVLEVDGEHRRARLNLANLYCRTNRLAQAQDEYDTLLDQDPNLVAAQMGLGVVYRKLGKYKKAVAEYRKALAANPNSAQVHYNTALLFDYYMDKPKQARFHYDRFRELGGNPDRVPKPEPVPTPEAVGEVVPKLPPATKKDQETEAKREPVPAEAVPLQVEPEVQGE